MKTKELIDIERALGNAKKCKDPKVEAKNIVNFFFNVSKNLKLIKAALSDFNTLIEARKQLEETEAGTKFEAARLELVQRFAKRDEENKFIIEHNNYVLMDYPQFNIEFAELQKEYAEFLEQVKQAEEQIAMQAEAEIVCELRMLQKRELPSDLSGEDFFVLIDIIEE